ncbi:MAG: putative glycolipid-binding domain-containing protein [Ancalomicrobiaceae bacterium]|nr:putative glycolipid-binding domain-containing protein [Ancalomicrobiaceae bacterium]
MSDEARTIRWRSLADGGLEHSVVKIGATGIAAEGVVIAGDGDAAYGLRYRVVVDAEWAGLRSLHVTRLGGTTVALRHDGYGEWTDGEGKKRADLSKCYDASLDATPFALSVMLKRMAWKPGKAQELSFIRIAAPSLEVTRIKAKVTATEPGRIYSMVAEDGSPEEIEVDDEGIVVRIGERLQRV